MRTRPWLAPGLFLAIFGAIAASSHSANSVLFWAGCLGSVCGLGLLLTAEWAHRRRP